MNLTLAAVHFSKQDHRCAGLRFCCAFRSRGTGASASGTAIPPKAQPGTLQHRSICLGGIQKRYMRLCGPEMMRRPKCCFCMLGLPRLTSMLVCVWGLDFLFPGISTLCAKDQKATRAYSGPVQLRLCWLARLQYSTSGSVSFCCAPSCCRQLAFAVGSLCACVQARSVHVPCSGPGTQYIDAALEFWECHASVENVACR